MTQEQNPPGSLGWIDLTVEDAPGIRDFYAAVIGWKSEGLSMGDYEDYVMKDAATGTSRSGICHRRGMNSEMVAGWIPYFVVADVDASLAECAARGGEQVGAVREAGAYGRFAVIRDPSGAVCALHQTAG